MDQAVAQTTIKLSIEKKKGIVLKNMNFLFNLLNTL